MLDSFFNVLIIIAVITIFIGRTVAEARKKKKAPPPKQPRVEAIHFEEEKEEDTSEYFKNLAAQGTAGRGAQAAAQAKVRKSNAALASKGKVSLQKAPLVTEPKPPVVKENVGALLLAPAQREFTLNLNHLSPLKQAVVLAEILGQPKGMV